MPGRDPSTGRAAWGTITRELIVDTATDIVRAGRYEEMTIRSLAAEMGVAPMSLYRHVRDKDDLLDEVVDRLLRRLWKPRVADSEWMAWVSEACERLRRFLVSEPAAIRVYLRHPVVTPSAVARMEAMLSVLRNAGLDDEGARRAYGALQTYTVGFAALESSRGRYSGRQPASDNPLVAQLAAYTTPRQFQEGLGYLLEAISQRVSTSSRRDGAPRRGRAAATSPNAAGAERNGGGKPSRRRAVKA